MTGRLERAGNTTVTQSRTPRASRTSTTVAAGATAIFTVGAEELVISPMATAVAGELRTTVPVVGLSVSVYGALSLVGAAMIGILGAYLPRRQLLLTAMAAFCLGTVVCALTPDVAVFMIGRGASGLAAGIMVPTLYGLVGDTVPYAQRGHAMGTIVSAWSLSLVLGVPAGGLLSNSLGWRWTFATLALFGLTTTFAIAISTAAGNGVAAGHGIADGASNTERSASGSRRAATVLYVISTLLNMTSFYGLYTYLGAALNDHYAQTSWMPEAAVIAYGLGFATCAVTGRRLDNRNYSIALPTTLVVISLTMLAIGRATPTVVGLVVALLTWGAGQGLTVTLLSTLLSQGSFRSRGATLALYTLATNLGVILGAALGGPIYAHTGLSALTLWTAGGTAGAAVTALAAHHFGRRRTP